MNRDKRKQWDRWFVRICSGVTWMAVMVLGLLLFHLVQEGFKWLDWDFLSNFPSRHPEEAGLKSALWGSIWLISMTAMISIPLGVATAIWLEEYAPRNRFVRVVEINIANLAGMPSILYGVLGLAIFVRFLGFDSSLWSGSMTMSLLVMPVIIIAAQGAIRAVPQSIREGAFALGARRWQVVLWQVLPCAVPGIMTGIILALSRAMGETAPMMMIGALSYVAFTGADTGVAAAGPDQLRPRKLWKHAADRLPGRNDRRSQVLCSQLCRCLDRRFPSAQSNDTDPELRRGDRPDGFDDGAVAATINEVP